MINNLTPVWDKLKNSGKPIFLYGMGDGAEKIKLVLDSLNIPVRGVFASDDFVRGQTFLGYGVEKYSDVVRKYHDIVVLLAFGTNRPEIISRIENIAKEQELYVPDLPVAESGYYDSDFFIKYEDKLNKVYDMLSDKESKQLFINILSFKLTGGISFLADNNEHDYLDFDNNEIFLDCGAYDGDTVLEFATKAGKYRHIYAIEPDKKNYSKLIENTSHLENITFLNLAVHSDSSPLPFMSKNGRNSKASVNSNDFIPANSIDNILGGKDVTYIKLDVEGNEYNAILGAKQTILKYKPKLQISSYHRLCDIFELPLMAKNIRSDYKVYFTKKTYYPPWDSYFVFI